MFYVDVTGTDAFLEYIYPTSVLQAEGLHCVGAQWLPELITAVLMLQSVE